MKKMQLYSLLFMALSMTALTLTSCSDNDDGGETLPSPAKFDFTYSLAVPNADDERQIVLDSLTSAITSIDNSASWLTVKNAADMQDGHPVLIVTTKKTDDNKGATAAITVRTENGQAAVVNIKRGVYGLGDAYSGANNDFLTDWEHQKTLQIQGMENAQKAPWVADAATTIPPSIRMNVSKALGWQMAFSYLNESSLEGTRYFALYNKWTGVLRVFTYIQNPAGYGSEVSFLVQMGQLGSAVQYPFYHSLEFGIPTSHRAPASLNRSAQLLGSDSKKQSQSFETWVTPYLQIDQSLGVRPGWYCFDLDFSGFVPEGVDWRSQTNEVKLTIVPLTRDDKSVTLRGSLTGSVAGTMKQEQIVQKGGGNAMSGICGVLDMISGKASASIAGCNTYASLMKNTQGGLGAVLNPIKYYGGFACSMASAALGYIGNITGEPATYDTIPGKIDLKLDAQLDLTGTISGYTSNNMPALNVAVEAINSRQLDNHDFGRGVWGLAEDPVVYVSKEDFLCNEDHIALSAKGNGKYAHTSFPDYEMRMVYFFDPTSVKININPDLFPNVQNVNITTSCGLYPNRNYGYSDCYRSLLMLPSRPVIDISAGKTTGLVRLNTDNSQSTDKTMRLHVVKPADLLDDSYETAANTKVVQQKGSNVRYHGRLIDDMGRQMMVNPQVYLPYVKTADNYELENPVMPDLVVTVNLSFEANGNTYTFSKCFIPRFELIGHSQLSGHYNTLKQYADDSRAQKATGKLANLPSVPVTSYDGDRLLAKTLKLLEKIK